MRRPRGISSAPQWRSISRASTRRSPSKAAASRQQAGRLVSTPVPRRGSNGFCACPSRETLPLFLPLQDPSAPPVAHCRPPIPHGPFDSTRTQFEKTGLRTSGQSWPVTFRFSAGRSHRQTSSKPCVSSRVHLLVRRETEVGGGIRLGNRLLTVFDLPAEGRVRTSRPCCADFRDGVWLILPSTTASDHVDRRGRCLNLETAVVSPSRG
jgi:hypothetical protein